MSGIKYYVVDTETTGLSVLVHEIVQISVIRCEDKVQVSRNIVAEHPETASPQALQITNKTLEDLKVGLPKEEAVDIFSSFFEEDEKGPEYRCIIAHNAPFDRRHLHCLWNLVGKRFPADLWLDSKELARAFAKKRGIIKPKLDLDSSLKMAGLKPRLGAHDATVDTQNTYNMWDKFMADGIDYLPLIKTITHGIVKTSSEEQYDENDF